MPIGEFSASPCACCAVAMRASVTSPSFTSIGCSLTMRRSIFRSESAPAVPFGRLRPTRIIYTDRRQHGEVSRYTQVLANVFKVLTHFYMRIRPHEPVAPRRSIGEVQPNIYGHWLQHESPQMQRLLLCRFRDEPPSNEDFKRQSRTSV